MIGEVALLTNPRAGHGSSALSATERAITHLRERGVRVRALIGDSAEHSRELAQTAVADGVDALVVVGGDGMIHCALPAVVGTDTLLGVIPAGTGNDQARQYGLPRSSPEAAAQIVADGHNVAIDIGVAETADGRRNYFSSVLAAGFDSLVSDRTNRMRWPRGRARYNLAMIVEFLNLRPLPFRVRLADGTALEQDVLLVAVGNTRSYGGGMRICPDADPTDGLFDVTIANAASRLTVIRQFPSVYRGTHVSRPEIRTFRTAGLELDCSGVNAYADGEYLGPLPASITLQHHAARVLVPPTVGRN